MSSHMKGDPGPYVQGAGNRGERKLAEERAAAVAHLVLDVDGVLTDGRIVYTTGGEQVMAFHVHDGLGIKLLAGAGIGCSIVTARGSSALERRAEELGIAFVHQGIRDKSDALQMVSRASGIPPEKIAAVGDDLVDLPMLLQAGFSAAVNGAQPAILPHVDYITSRPGGQGAVREVCEFILKAKGLYDKALSGYLGKGAESTGA